MDDITRRLKRKRGSRRRFGLFDHCSDSWDMRTTYERAFRIHLRLHGRREPLRTPWGKPVRFNEYHD